MLVKVNTAVIEGCQARPVIVECDIEKIKNAADFRFDIVGLADTAIKEARTRVLTALTKTNCQIKGKILVNLAPAEVKKEGAGLDLSIAVALLTSVGKLQKFSNNDWFFGELALDGSVRKVQGLTACLLGAIQAGAKRVFVPHANLAEVSVFNDLEFIAIRNIYDLFHYQQGELSKSERVLAKNKQSSLLVFADIVGQEVAKRAMLVAAAGGHHLLFVGPPGCGKSMLAERFGYLLPDLSYQQKLESAAIHSVVGDSLQEVLDGRRPFRSPHYNISEAGLIGGGVKLKPGEISLAHNGVLFLDELPEYKRGVIESLRIPLEKRYITLNRAKYHSKLPASFQLLAAMNPCPCGKLGVPDQDCHCLSSEIKKYLGKISQPILDRIDLQVSLQAVKLQKIYQNSSEDQQSEQELVNSVRRARAVAMERQGSLNAELNNQKLKSLIKLTAKARNLLEQIAEKQHLTARGYFRILKVALTIQDLEGKDSVSEKEISEASIYRSLDLIKTYVAS